MSLQDPGLKGAGSYRAIVNQEEQYAIWPATTEVPSGWRDVGKVGSKSECLAFIREVWTDMRPLSLREQMSESARKHAPGSRPAGDGGLPEAPEETLVDYLSRGRHPVESSLRAEKTAQALKERIDLGYIHIKFTETRGGTELGVRLNREATDLSQADFESQTGAVHLEGDLTLNDVRVRCVADIDLRTFSGQGHLVPVPAENGVPPTDRNRH